jgi:tRNA (guanine-N7-)-methyltransferase
MKNRNKKRSHPNDDPINNTTAATTTNADDTDNGQKDETLTNKQKEAITPDGEMPQKRFYRSRAHCNPLSHNDHFEYPLHPDLYDWKMNHYPNFGNSSTIETNDATNKLRVLPTILDIGCGFGGLTTALSTILPDQLILGLEIRAKVTEYVRLRILALRKENPGQFENCSVLKSNTMKLMPHFFPKASLEKIFFCFPDPHFKKKNHSRRIVAEKLLSEYAYFLKDGGKLYTITDVEDLHNWHVKHCRAHPMFRELSNDELEDDPCVKAMYSETEEGKKVERAGTKKYYAVYEKLNFKKVEQNVSAENFWDDGQFGVIHR